MQCGTFAKISNTSSLTESSTIFFYFPKKKKQAEMTEGFTKMFELNSELQSNLPKRATISHNKLAIVDRFQH